MLKKFLVVIAIFALIFVTYLIKIGMFQNSHDDGGTFVTIQGEIVEIHKKNLLLEVSVSKIIGDDVETVNEIMKVDISNLKVEANKFKKGDLVTLTHYIERVGKPVEARTMEIISFQ